MSEFNFQNLVRENVKKLKPYSSARTEFTQEADVFIDANENPYETVYNRYPDPLQWKLKESICKIKKTKLEETFLGNGSDEIIDLLIRCVCEPNRDNIITFSPSYTMYKTSAEINAVDVKTIELNGYFSIPLDRIQTEMDANSKILFLCSPNNPVGCLIPRETIESCCKTFNGLVVVDEAYIDFAESKSSLKILSKYPNLVVIQTLSKAYGLAALRIGMGFASKEIIDTLNKIKPPYNISGASQLQALRALRAKQKFASQRDTIIEERKKLFEAFSQMKIFDKVYPSDANFVLATSKEYKEIYDFLCANKVIARLRHIPPALPCGLRFTVGTPEENSRVIMMLEEYMAENKE